MSHIGKLIYTQPQNNIKYNKIRNFSLYWSNVEINQNFYRIKTEKNMTQIPTRTDT